MEKNKHSKSIKKRLAAFLLYTLLTLFLLILFVSFLLRQNFVQNYIAQEVTSYLSKTTGTMVTLKALQIDVIKGIEASDVQLNDTLGRPILKIGELKAQPEWFELLAGRFRFRSASLDTVDLRMIIRKGQDNYSFIQFINKLSGTDTTSSSNGKPFKLTFRRINLSQVHFTLHDENIQDTIEPHTIDFNDLDIRHGNIKLRNFNLTDGTLRFVIMDLSAVERSGFEIKKFRSDVTIDPRHFIFKNTVAEANHSKVQVSYEMQGPSWATYSYYNDSVRMVAQFGPSVLDMSDLGYFSSVMFTMPNTLRILGGNVEGPVRDLHSTNLNFEYGEKTHFFGDVSFTGLPDFYNSEIHADIKNLTVSFSDIKSFGIPGDSTTHIILPDAIKKFKPIEFSGRFDGKYGDFVTRLQIKPKDHGLLNLGIALKTNNDSIVRLGLNVNGTDFPLNEIIQSNGMLGDADFQGSVFTNKALPDSSGMHIHFAVKKIYVNSYNYHNVNFTGLLEHDTLKTALKVDDPHLDMLLDGFANLKSKPEFHLNLALHKADFDSLNWWTAKDFHLKTEGKIYFRGLDPDSMTARVLLTNSELRFKQMKYPVSKIFLDKYIIPGKGMGLKINSDLLKFSMVGNYGLSELARSTGQFLNHFFPVTDMPPPVPEYASKDIDVNLELLKPSLICDQFLGGLQISPDAFFKAKIDFKNHTMEAEGHASMMKYQGVNFLNNNLHAQTIGGALQVKGQIEHLILKDSTKTDKSVFGMDSLVARMNMKNDSLEFGLFWNNKGTKLKNAGDIEGLYLKHDSIQKLSINKSNVFINDMHWNIQPENAMINDKQGWRFENFLINGGDSRISFLGRIPSQEGDSLEVTFHNWNLANLNLLWRHWGFNLDGKMNGYVNISNMGTSFARVANLTIDSLSLNKSGLGTAYILSTWDNVNNSAFFKAQIIREGDVSAKRVFGMEGFYYPYNIDNQLDMNLTFNGIKLNGVNPFLSEYISKLHGEASGTVMVHGTLSAPELSGELTLDNVGLVINYLNTKYSFKQNTFVFNKNDIDFGKFMLYDTLGNHAEVQGKLLHHNFHDPRLDVNLSTNRLLFFNTTRSMNQVYYGTAIGSGDVSIKGPLDDIQMDLNVQSEKGTSVVLPLDDDSEFSENNFIIFQKPEKDTLKGKVMENVLNTSQTQESQYQININMGILPSAMLKIYLPSGIGTIESQGEGNLKLQVNSSGDVSLAGDYSVDRGAFDFTLADLVRKHFELVKGGRISWSGDPYKATVNIKGLYKLKADISTLGVTIDTTASYKNRVNVDCYVVMSKDLFNPQIGFQIKFPDLDPDLQRLAYAQLDTTNTALMNQQMISLLVLRSFSMNNITNATLSSSYYSILSNQLSGLLSRISKNINVGVSYKPGDKMSKEEFDLALSTQLFNDRLAINGNFGMSYDKQSNSTSNLVGDVDIDYKLTKDGRWRLKAFNHSNVNSWYYYTNYDKISPYTQGAGIVYTKAFDNFWELFGKKKKPHARKIRNNDKAKQSEEKKTK
ncbi:MAG: translocation/assembly module TamB [Bacteroidales bacterium]|nr:translocation/assembly module TamB [Bacteroidales bacterium]